jgi:hypothetical protein
MQKAIFLLTFSCIYLLSSAQAYEDKTQYDKKKQAAIAIEYNYPPEAVQNAIIRKFSQLGYKPKEEKGIFNSDRGFFQFKNAYVTDITKERLDFIFQVERKSRKESDESQVYLIMYKNEENALDKLEAMDVGKAKTFLNNLLPEIEAEHLELQIRDQENALAKSEKKLKTLQEEKLDLEKRLIENQKNQDNTIKEIDMQTDELEKLKGKRKRE